MTSPVVRINRLDVQPGREAELEERFAARLRRIDAPGFLGFELLRPTSGQRRYWVITRWASAESFDAWRDGPSFHRGHAPAPDGAPPVASTAGLLGFEQVLAVSGLASGPSGAET